MIEVVCAIIVKGNKILATQLGSNSQHPYKWEFPGGKIKKGETPEFALTREINEELLIKVCPELKLEEIPCDYGFKKILLIPFICRIYLGDPVLTEHIQLKWINFEEFKNIDFAEADLNVLNSEKNKKLLLDYLGKNVDKSC